MAGDWIKMRANLATCPQVVRIASGQVSACLPDACPQAVRAALVVGALHATWALFDSHTEDGQLANYTPAVLDAIVGLEGWTSALADVGWIDVSADGLTLPDFERHNGASAKRRAQDTDRKRKVRKLSAAEADRCPPGKRTESGPEKRREESMQHARARELPDAAAAVPPPEVSEPEPPPATAPRAEYPDAAALVFEVLSPGGLGQGAIPEALELLSGPAWLGGHPPDRVRAALTERVEAARGKRNAGAWLLTALRNGEVPPQAPDTPASGDPRLRPWDAFEGDEAGRARRDARLHREEAERLEHRAERLNDPAAAVAMRKRAAAHRRTADDLDGTAAAVGVGG